MQRKTHLSAWFASAPCLLLLLTALPAMSQPPTYSIVDLGTLNPDDQFDQAFGINNYGQVSGFAVSVRGIANGFLWTPNTPHGSAGQMTDLGPSAGGQSGAYKVNDYGQVLFNGVGGAFLLTPAVPNGTSGSATSIGGLISGSTVNGAGLNSVGQVVGYGYPGVCFLWTPDMPQATTGTFNSYFNGTDYEPGFGYSSYQGSALGVNDYGQVTGAFSLRGTGFPILHSDPNDHYSVGDIIPGSENSPGEGKAINNAGHIVGYAFFPGADVMHPFFYDGTTFSDLSSGPAGVAFAINSSDQVVGSVNGRAFLYTAGVSSRLVDLIDPAAGWIPTDAFGINDSGQIAGIGNHNGATRMFLMSPL